MTIRRPGALCPLIAAGVVAASSALAQRSPTASAAAPIASASASVNPRSFDPATFPAELAALKGKPVSQCRAELARFGLSHAEGSDVVSAVAAHGANLDSDPDTEIVAVLTIRPPENESEPVMEFNESYNLVWLDRAMGRLTVSGTEQRDVGAVCGTPGQFELQTVKVHSAQFDDVVLGILSYTGSCTAQYIFARDEVLTLQRGRVESLLAFEDHAGCGVVRGMCSNPNRAQLSGPVPHVVEIVDDKGSVKSRRRFDTKAFRYK